MGDSGTVRALNSSAPKHAWTSADREFLGVTHRLYDITNIELTQIFNTLNDDRLQQEGLRNGLKTTAISSQVADLKRTDRGGVFRDVLSMSTSDVRNRFGELILHIQQAAATLGIALPTRQEDIVTTVSTMRRLPKARLNEWATESEASMSPPGQNHIVVEVNPPKRRRISATPSPSSSPAYTNSSFTKSQSPMTLVTCSDSRSSSTPDVDSDSTGSWRTDSDSDGGDTHLVICDNDFPATASRINPRLRISFNLKGKSASLGQRPRLLFRAFDPAHRLRARQFLHSSQEVPPPPTMNNLGDMVFRHLSIDKNFQSPFLSWTESALRALKLIAKSASPLYLAIVDYNVYEDAQEGNFGERTGLWLVPKLCESFGFADLEKLQDEPSTPVPRNRKGYTGIGEFLSWGSLTCETVAILDTEAATKLYQTMRCIQELSHESGLHVSQCLNDVRPIYREVVAYKLLRNFEVLRPSQGSSGASYEAFVDGLYGTALADNPDIIVVESESRIVTRDGNSLPQQGLIFPTSSKGATTVEIPTKLSSSPPDKSSRPSVRALSPDEDVLQSLIDTQLSNTGEPFGIIVITNDDDSSSGEPIGKIQMASGTAEVIERNSEEPKEAAYVQAQPVQLPEEDTILKLRCETSDNACENMTLYPIDEDYPMIKDEPEPEDIFMKELIETAEIFTPLPSVDTSIDILKDDSETALKATFEENKNVLETKPLKSSNIPETRRSVVKAANKIDISKLFDRHRASLLVRTDHAASTSATGPGHSAVVDLTNDTGANVRRPPPKKRQTYFSPPQVNEGYFNNAVDLTTDAGQAASQTQTAPSNPRSTAMESNSINNTTDTTGPDLHKVLDAAHDDEDVQIIGTATVRHRRRVRTTTHTVLTVRSRSVSESLTFAAGATPHPREK
ncbi:hypothetical protein LTS15_009205 [Exophiala xenobiotica]|nr:hypothetical protein LTS15_009205 [Exophiala xenobiotica]